MAEMLKHNSIGNGLDNDFFFDMDELTDQLSYSMGKNDAIESIVKNMLKENYSDDDILKITEISKEKLNEIKKV